MSQIFKLSSVAASKSVSEPGNQQTEFTSSFTPLKEYFGSKMASGLVLFIS